MTISRKLSLIAALGLNLGAFNASAYDVVGLKDEVQIISAFANQHNNEPVEYNDQTIYLDHWLNNKINSTWMTSNSKIIEIANLIRQNNDEELVRMIKQDIIINQFKKSVAIVIGAGAYIMLLYGAIKHDISFPLELKILSSDIKTLVALDKMQQQINDLTQKVDKKSWIQKLFAKQ